jgi:thiol:disulfide interchange protein
MLPWRTQMIGEAIDGPKKLDQAKEAVQAATQTVKETTQSVADAAEASRQPGGPLDRLARWAQAAPLHAVTVAFLIGVLLGRHRG